MPSWNITIWIGHDWLPNGYLMLTLRSVQTGSEVVHAQERITKHGHYQQKKISFNTFLSQECNKFLSFFIFSAFSFFLPSLTLFFTLFVSSSILRGLGKCTMWVMADDASLLVGCYVLVQRVITIDAVPKYDSITRRLDGSLTLNSL